MEYVVDANNMLPVYKCSWPASIPERIWSHNELLDYLTNQRLPRSDWTQRRILLIIDEAQGFYKYLNL